jgi:ADP-heptose:LPS heptosyltransferase
MIHQLAARLMVALCAVFNHGLEIFRLCLWPRPMPKRPRRICVYRNGQVGDTLCAVPAMFAIRRAYPDAHLTLLTTPVLRSLPSAKDILEGAAWIDEISVYYKDEIDTLPKSFQFVRALRRRRFDVWIELPIEVTGPWRLIRNMLAARLAGARWGCGWRVSFLDLAVQAQAECRTFPNEVERLMELLHRYGLDSGGEVAFPLPDGSAQEQRVDALLREHALDDSSRLVAIAPSAKREPNRWPSERFAQTGKHLVALGYQVLVLAGRGDAELCEEVVRRIGFGSLSLAGKTSIGESCELLRRCELLICNDSGVQHMAAAVGTPCISIFSARDMPGKWSPYGREHVVLRKSVECHTCFTEKCPRGNLCINMVTVEETIAAIDAKLEHRNGKAA